MDTSFGSCVKTMAMHKSIRFVGNLMLSLFAKKNTEELPLCALSIREAKVSDLNFLSTQFSIAMSEGHFFKQSKEAIDNMLLQAIQNNEILRLTENGIEAIPMWGWIAEFNGNLAAFLFCTPESPLRPNTTELYFLGVDKSFRKRGVATALIRHELARAKKTSTFYARCYAKSSWAKSLLLKHGFKIERISASGMTYLRMPGLSSID